MAYIGRGIDNISQIEVLDLITFTNSAGPYNILKGAVAFIPSTVNSLLIEVDGIIQAPASYTVDGSTITFGVSMPSTSTMNSMIHFGTGLITTPADGSVTAAKIASDAVTTAKILDNNVTVAKLPTTLDVSGNTVTLPASVSGLGTGITNAQLAGSIDVTSKITGVVPTANLGSGSASSSTYLAGDQTYKSITAVDIAWQSVVTSATLTAVAGRGYPINTTSNACTVTLPASASVGDQIIFTDYARKWGTNAVTINQNSLKYQGETTPNPVYDTEGESLHIVYMDATQGWTPINDGAVANEVLLPYVTATGPDGAAGTIDGDYKYHVFNATKTGSNGFSVSSGGLVSGSNTVEYVTVAGGAGGGTGRAAGGGAGGMRTASGLSVTVQDYDITIGAGGAGSTDSSVKGANGTASTGIGLATVGGGGGGSIGTYDGVDGGSGGGAITTGTAGTATAGEGNAGSVGAGAPSYGSGAGGGKGGAGGAGSGSTGGTGGTGLNSSITGSAVGYAGGGGGGVYITGTPGSATHGGGAGSLTGAASNATVNTGGGGGGGGYLPSTVAQTGGNGGTGVMIIRYKFQN